MMISPCKLWPRRRRVRTFYRQHHRRISRLALRQAYVPQGASILPNPIGTAPGIWLPFNESVIIALPGVPQEMRAIMDASVLPRLRAGHDRGALATRLIRVAGLVELQVQQALQTVRMPSNVQVGFYPHLGTVDVSLVASGTRQTELRHILSRLEREIRQRLGAAVYGRDRDTLEAVVGRALMKRRWTVAVAESCTGGLISDRLTDVPGSSRYVVLSVVAYHNAIKQRLLGVEPEILAKHGAVSQQTAAAMARGVRQRAGADVGLAITGIAGPSGATATKPVGLVSLGLAIQSRTRTARLLFHGDRRSIKEQACQAALDWLRRSV
jgi:nicotinamide-nucleotide amidase